MADYYAVLSRTLSGFGDPNLQLRDKLYERARVTIRRQLDNRTPPLDPATIAAEMDKLEQAVADIEASYGDAAPAAPTAEPELPQPAPPPPAPAPLPPVEPQAPQSAQPAAARSDFGFDAPEAAAPQVDEEPVDDHFHPDDMAAAMGAASAGSGSCVGLAMPSEAQATPTNAEPVQADDPIVGAIEEFTKADAERRREMEAEAARKAQLESEMAGGDAPRAPELPPVAEPSFDPVDDVMRQTEELRRDAEQVPDADTLPPVPELPKFDDDFSRPSDDLAIPPAPMVERPKRSAGGGIGKWVVPLVVLIALGAAGWFGFQNRDAVMATLGLSSGNGTPAPKPVKTVTIRPDANNGEAIEDEPISEPKVEARLTEDGEEVDTSSPGAVLAPPADDGSQVANSGDQMADATPGDSSTAPSSGQAGETAILYEEGSTPNANNQDAGSVVWSVVNESPGNGAAAEPAIRAQVEIPDRKTVLIMTLKRNSDPALTASHIIELIFAVPEDFSGGSISEVQRFVMKESEQARGEALQAIPVKISDGIFLIALDNLNKDRTANEALLQQRDWIDIPMQYRTGRRALVTLEKGEEGKRVFDEVFDAWSKL